MGDGKDEQNYGSERSNKPPKQQFQSFWKIGRNQSSQRGISYKKTLNNFANRKALKERITPLECTRTKKQ